MIRRITLIALLLIFAGACQPSTIAPFPRSGIEIPNMELGLRLMRAGQAQMALNAFNRALAEGGIEADELIATAAAYRLLGRRKDALKLLRSAIVRDPNSALARNNLGVMLYEDGDAIGARSELEGAYALTNGLNAQIATNIGIVEFAINNREEAEFIGDDVEFDVIQYGHGVFKLERRVKSEEEPT